MSPSLENCVDCTPTHVRRSVGVPTAFSALPFIITFLGLEIFVAQKIFPLLTASSSSGKPSFHDLTLPLRGSNSDIASQKASITSTKRISRFVFSTTIALSVVLTELLLCEISNSFNPVARRFALQFTVTSLLGLLIIAIPLLELYSVIAECGWKFKGGNGIGKLHLAWVLEVVGYGIFLLGFWSIGQLLPYRKDINEAVKSHGNMVSACLERLGVTGVSLMGLLSGFASVSSIWQNFGAKPKPLSETDISRKQAGLEATRDMLRERKQRLTQLQHKIADTPTQGFWSKAVGTVRGNADTQEKKVLELEISGLETMMTSLETSLAIFQSRRAAQLQSTTTLGRLAIAFSYGFSCYCVYRICTTILNITRRWLYAQRSSSSTASTDPITNAIALFARHIYPSLDQASWARQISFFLSGIMLLASFSAVMQTFHLFARFIPSVLRATRSNFALLLSQVSGMYVISSALMLRGMMPKEVGSVINDALGAGVLEPAWVERWFDGFFIGAVLITVQGIWVGRKFSGIGAWEDEAWDTDVEMGKRM